MLTISSSSLKIVKLLLEIWGLNRNQFLLSLSLSRLVSLRTKEMVQRATTRTTVDSCLKSLSLQNFCSLSSHSPYHSTHTTMNRASLLSQLSCALAHPHHLPFMGLVLLRFVTVSVASCWIYYVSSDANSNSRQHVFLSHSLRRGGAS